MITFMIDAPTHILYDGNCPLCLRQVEFLQRRDRKARLRYVDIRTEQEFCKQSGIDADQLEKQIHAVLADGTVLGRMDAVRAAYRAIGHGRWVAVTAWPVLRPLFDLLYGLVAKHRIFLSRMTGTTPKNR